MKLTQNETNNPHNKDDQNVKEKKKSKKTTLPNTWHTATVSLLQGKRMTGLYSRAYT